MVKVITKTQIYLFQPVFTVTFSCWILSNYWLYQGFVICFNTNVVLLKYSHLLKPFKGNVQWNYKHALSKNQVEMLNDKNLLSKKVTLNRCIFRIDFSSSVDNTLLSPLQNRNYKAVLETYLSPQCLLRANYENILYLIHSWSNVARSWLTFTWLLLNIYISTFTTLANLTARMPRSVTEEFTFTFGTRSQRSTLKVNITIPLNESVKEFSYRLINAHQLPCFVEGGKNSRHTLHEYISWLISIGLSSCTFLYYYYYESEVLFQHWRMN